MDAISSVVCLLVGSVIPLAILFVLVRRGMRQLAVAEAYTEVSRRLALVVDTRGVSLHGHLDDRRVWVGQVMVGHGPNRRHVCWGVLDLQRPLGLGLLLRRRGLSERLFRRARRPEVVLPGGTLERRLEIHGDDANQVRRLLDDRVQECLEVMLKRWRDVVVTDHSVRVHLKQPLARPDELVELVEGLRRLADELDRARAAMPAPDGLEGWAPAWQDLAARLGLSWNSAFHALEGEREGYRMRLGVARSPSSYRAELKLWFREHRTSGLLLMPQAGPGDYAALGQDIQVGSAEFDASFVVKGYDPDAVCDLLSSEVRQALLELAAVGTIEVDDKDLHARDLPLDPDVLIPLVDAAQRAAVAMGW